MKAITAVALLLLTSQPQAAIFYLSWPPPTNCTDGTTSCIASIVSTRIYWQQGAVPAAGQLVGSKTIPMPATSADLTLPDTLMCFRLYYVMASGVESDPSTLVCRDKTDTDADGVLDSQDNCTLVANFGQVDADHDGYGNSCDGDLNNSGLVTAQDMAVLQGLLNTTDPVADLNGSGLVTAADATLLRAMLNQAPGPSGLACAGTIPC